MPKRIIIKLEQHKLPVPSYKVVNNKVAYIRKTLTKDNSKFSTKNLMDRAEAFNGNISEDAIVVIKQNIYQADNY